MEIGTCGECHYSIINSDDGYPWGFCTCNGGNKEITSPDCGGACVCFSAKLPVNYACRGNRVKLTESEIKLSQRLDNAAKMRREAKEAQANDRDDD